MWLVLAIHLSIMWGENLLPNWFWAVIFFHTLVQPHLAFMLATNRRHECANLLIDITAYGIYVGTWGFNPFLAAVFVATANLTLLSSGGWKIMSLGLAAQLIGALFGGWLTNFYFRQYLALTPMLIATAGFFGFMMAMGWLMHKINRRLHATRSHIKEQHDELTHINELSVAVNSQSRNCGTSCWPQYASMSRCHP